MTDGRQSFPIRVARFGVPMVIGIFYLTASLGFDFTSESAMAMASLAKYGFGPPLAGGYPSPLWEFLLTVGGRFHLDPVLSGKVLSLVFSCLTILVCFLLAHEILRDHIMAFCAILIVAMQGWFLQIGPSGSSLSAAMALTMVVLFFMLRNEYVVAPFILGLATLVYWQAIFLLIPLCVDIWINSVNKQRAVKVLLGAGLAYACALLPWIAFSWTNHEKAIPVMLQVPELPPLSSPVISFMVVLGALGCAGLALSFSGERHESIRANAGPLLFAVVVFALGGVLHSEVWYAGLALVVIYAFPGLTGVIKRFGRDRLTYSLSFVITGLLLISFQREYYRENRPSMAFAIAQAQELCTAAGWIRTNALAGQSICAEHPLIVEYYVERPVTPVEQSKGSSCNLVVTSRAQMPGYELAFSPKAEFDDVPALRYSVWRKK